MLEDTIIAVATPPGVGGLGIVRISGPNAVTVASSIFHPKAGAVKEFPVRRPIFGAVRDGQGDHLDEAFLTYFKAPRSYTREDVVEISTHGSPAVLEEVVRMGVRAGARLARPGEFTLRAYLNGRIDVLQAEAVNDLVRSMTLTQAKVSSRQIGGSLSRKVWKIRRRLVSFLSRIEAGLEFPEEGTRRSASISSLDRRTLRAVRSEVAALVSSYEAGRIVGEGALVAIAGRTNVGKSTLFNALLEEERAIVTPFPGTTRDFLRERLVVDDIVFHLVDMAGLGRPGHPVERRGMAKGRRIADEADGLLLVLDGSTRAALEDEKLLRRYGRRNVLVVVNKTDLPRKLDRGWIERAAPGKTILDVSALKGQGIGELKRAIRNSFGPTLKAGEEEIVLHARQRDLLERVLEALDRAERVVEQRGLDELLAEEIRGALPLIGELTGEVRVDEVINGIFERFCVGK